MEKPLSITTHHLDLPAPVEAVIRERAGRLEHFYPSLVGCSVRVEGPGRHHREGGPFNVQIDLRVPGGEPLVVSRQDGRDLRDAVRGAFQAATRQLEDFARVQRGDTKAHEPLQGGRAMYAPSVIEAREIEILTSAGGLHGTLTVPPGAVGIVLFAHGSGSSRLSPRNRKVAADLQDAGLATLLFDLLTKREEAEDRHDAHLRFDIGLLAERLETATDWALRDGSIRDLPIGYFGASTGAAAALVAAAASPEVVKAVVSRGGRPDLAGEALARVVAPTLLIVGGEDTEVLHLNQQAMRQMPDAPVQIEIIPGATHLFEEPGTLEKVSALAADWFRFHLGAAPPRG